jgi:hypothetical protein
MIIEDGTTSQFKECLFANVPATRCQECGSVVMVGSIGPMDYDGLIKASGARTCCIKSMTEDWLKATEDLMAEMVKHDVAQQKTLAMAIKLTRHLLW